jgi:HK97 family phage prohead protease
VDEHGAVRIGGQVTNPGGTERLHEYWVHGEGAAKIRWGTPGDFGRCVDHLGKFIKDPQGYCNLAHHAALGIYPATHAAMEHKGRSQMATTTQEPDVADGRLVARGELMRDYPLEDLHIVRSGDGGDGRTMEAFAAVFNTETGIRDHEGVYLEVIESVAFNKRINDVKRSRPGFGQVKVLFNHGRDMEGNPAERFQMPVAVPVSIEATPRGLLTRSRFVATPLGEEVLELVKSGAVTAMSFTGRIILSDPQLGRGQRRRPDSSGRLSVVRRMELGLREFGPVLFPAYEGAEINSVRMWTPGSQELDEEHDPGTSPDGEAAAGEPLTPDDGAEHSARYHQHALYALRSKELREKHGLVW